MSESHPTPVILVVDDEPDARETLRELLEYEGYTVAVAADGREAVAFLATDDVAGRTCIILLDLFMPVMNGWEFVEELRTNGTGAKVKVVITTSAPNQAPAGFNVLAKPLDPDKLLATIKKHCE
jgi:CheY-like chemotaxis protein